MCPLARYRHSAPLERKAIPVPRQIPGALRHRIPIIHGAPLEHRDWDLPPSIDITLLWSEKQTQDRRLWQIDLQRCPTNANCGRGILPRFVFAQAGWETQPLRSPPPVLSFSGLPVFSLSRFLPFRDSDNYPIRTAQLETAPTKWEKEKNLKPPHNPHRIIRSIIALNISVSRFFGRKPQKPAIRVNFFTKKGLTDI